MLGLVLVVVDDTVSGIALPSIAEAFQAPPSSVVWVVNAYQLVAMALLIPFARLADIFGHRNLFLGGALVLVSGAIGSISSETLTQLIVARTVTGIGAAGIMSVNIALTRFIHPAHTLGQAFGYNALVVAASISMAPMIAGFILSLASWQWLFISSIPLGIVVAVLAWRYFPATGSRAEKFDYTSAILCSGAMALLILGIGAIPRTGVPFATLLLLSSGLLIWVLWRRERKQASPLAPVDLFDIRPFRLAILSSCLFFTAQSVVLISLPFYLQSDLGQSEAAMGLMMTPWPAAIALMAPIAGRLADHFRPAYISAAGLTIMFAGILALALMPDAPGAFEIAWRSFLAGVGVSLFQIPNNRVIMLSVPFERSGPAAGVQASARLLGQASGVAMAGIVFAYTADESAKACLVLSAGLCACALIFTLLRERTAR